MTISSGPESPRSPRLAGRLHGRSGSGMNRSIGAEADAETEYEPIGNTRRTSAETVTVTLAASPPAATLTFDVIEPAEPSITPPATEPGVARSGGRGDRRVLRRRLGDVAGVLHQGVLQHHPERQEQRRQRRSPSRPPPIAPPTAAASVGDLAGVGVEAGDDDHRHRRRRDRQGGEEDDVAGELARLVVAGAAIVSSTRSLAVIQTARI